eukprot:s75_g3.t1
MIEDGLWAPEDLGGQQTEEAMKEDLWEAVCQANRQDGSDVTLRRFGASRVAGLPILDPPTVQSRNQLIREDSPQVGMNTNVKHTNEELLAMGKANFVRLVSAFEHSLAGSAQEKIHQRSDLEAMVEQIEQGSLEDEGQELLQCWKKGRDVLQQLGEESVAAGDVADLELACAKAESLLFQVLGEDMVLGETAASGNASRAGAGRDAEEVEGSSAARASAGRVDSASETPASVGSVLRAGAGRNEENVEMVHELTQALVGRVERLAAGDLELACARAESLLFQVLGEDMVLGEMAASGNASRAGAGRDAEDVEGSSAARASAGRVDSASETPASVGSVLRAGAGRNEENVEMAHELTQALVGRVERLAAGGGEIPCHFTTLTTAIYHWQDLAACLETYENAVLVRRHGRRDPLEPSERNLDPHRRRVLRYPGVVAWFTGYKMELFYKYVLQYEDGQGIFEWGAGGIMHLHSINFGSQMPRIDPTAPEMEFPNEKSMQVAQQFAAVHEEYLTDWSLGKAEKWSFQEVENGVARRTRCASPVHTDSESDGSEDLDGDVACAPVRAARKKKLFPSVQEEEAVSLSAGAE